jgi:hypothetical protein
MKERFPVGGEREPVYNFMRDHGFVRSQWSDKVWERADGLQASIFGAGSMVRLSRATGGDVIECKLVEMPLHLRL